jgi:hypothetical protein
MNTEKNEIPAEICTETIVETSPTVQKIDETAVDFENNVVECKDSSWRRPQRKVFTKKIVFAENAHELHKQKMQKILNEQNEQSTDIKPKRKYHYKYVRKGTKVGRKRKYPEFHIARQTARELNMKSSTDYIRWHKVNQPPYLPRYPDRVYKEFISWMDFLGTKGANPLARDARLLRLGHVFRPFWQAVKWSQAYCHEHKLTSGSQWSEYVKRHDIPDDIPEHPEGYYDEWKSTGWNTWVGKQAEDIIAAEKVQTHIFAICSFRSIKVPGNYYALIHAKGGDGELNAALNNMNEGMVIRCYKWEDALQDKVMRILSMFCKDVGEGKALIPNVNALIFELDNMLLWHTFVRVVGQVKPVDPMAKMFPESRYKQKINYGPW